MIMRRAILTIKISILNAYFYPINYLKILPSLMYPKMDTKINVSKIGYKMRMYPKMDTKRRNLYPKMYPKMEVSKNGYMMIKSSILKIRS